MARDRRRPVSLGERPLRIARAFLDVVPRPADADLRQALFLSAEDEAKALCETWPTLGNARILRLMLSSYAPLLPGMSDPGEVEALMQRVDLGLGEALPKVVVHSGDSVVVHSGDSGR